MSESFNFIYNGTWETAYTVGGSFEAVSEFGKIIAELPAPRNAKVRLIESQGAEEDFEGVHVQNVGRRTIVELDGDDMSCLFVGDRSGFQYSCVEKLERR